MCGEGKPSSLVQPSVDRFSVVKNTFMGGDVWRSEPSSRLLSVDEFSVTKNTSIGDDV